MTRVTLSPLEIERSKVKVSRLINAKTENVSYLPMNLKIGTVQGLSLITRNNDTCGEIKGQRSRSWSCRHSDARLFIYRQRKVAETPKLARRLSVPRMTFRASFKVKRSKVKVIRPLWMAVQVTTCRGLGHVGRTACLYFTCNCVVQVEIVPLTVSLCKR